MRNSLILIFSISIILTSCFDPSKPNFQYFPDMYESLAYETYAESETLPFSIINEKIDFKFSFRTAYGSWSKRTGKR